MKRAQMDWWMDGAILIDGLQVSEHTTISAILFCIR
jgi:hypothetical protein